MKRSALPLAGGRLSSFVLEHLGVGEPGGVVDADVDELPAGGAAPANTALVANPDSIGADPAIGGHPMPGDDDPPELLDVDVDELAGALSLVAVRRLGRLESREPSEADPPQPPRDGRERHLQALGDLGGGHPQSPQRLDRPHALGRDPLGRAPRS
jgi:hypothetical protein